MRGLSKSIKDYRLGSQLGKGGFATVLKAIYLPKNEEVAIKMINKTSIKKTHMMQKVKDEASIHAQVEHPSILKLYSCFEDDDYVYLVLEYCRNGELGRYLQRHNRTKLSEAEACSIVRQVLDGLLYLHSYGILHRDIKMANLLLNDKNRIKIADFGLATKLSHPMETHVTMCGTPNYISPEVASEVPHGLGVDVWGLGVLLFTLLFGQAPFATATIKCTLNKVVSENLYIPEVVSSEAHDLLQRLLEKNPMRRITAEDAARHPFFQLYPDTPLHCGVAQDSGLGPCSMCSCSRWEESVSTPTMSHLDNDVIMYRSGSIRSKGGGSAQHSGLSHSTMHSCQGSLNKVLHPNSSSYDPSPYCSKPNLHSINNRSYGSAMQTKQSARRELTQQSFRNSSISLPSCRTGSQKDSFHTMQLSRNFACQLQHGDGVLNGQDRACFEDTSGFVDDDQLLDTFPNIPSRVEDEMALFSTARLTPTRLATQQSVFHILPSGEAVLERPVAGNRVRYWVVTKHGYMVKHTIQQPAKIHPPAIPRDSRWHPLTELPPSLRRPYRDLANFVKSVQATTIKITLHTKEASCRLMESSPDDFLVDFFSGETMEKHGNSVTVDCSGRPCIEYMYHNLMKDCQQSHPHITDLFLKFFKKCLRLEKFLNEEAINGIDLFPASFGVLTHQPSKEPGKTKLSESERSASCLGFQGKRAQSTPVKPLFSRDAAAIANR